MKTNNQTITIEDAFRAIILPFAKSEFGEYAEVKISKVHDIELLGKNDTESTKDYRFCVEYWVYDKETKAPLAFSNMVFNMTQKTNAVSLKFEDDEEYKPEDIQAIHEDEKPVEESKEEPSEK